MLAFGHLVGAFQAVGVETVGPGSFVGEAGEVVIGLVVGVHTRYSWKAKGTSLTLRRWFSGRSRRWSELRG